MTSTLPSLKWPAADRLMLAVVLIFTLLVRGGVLWALHGNLADDPDAYRQIAENLLRHGVFAMGTGDNPQPTAYRPPLYPVVLSNLPASDGRRVSLPKVAVLHLLLGVLTVWLTWLVARRVGSAHQNPAGKVGTAHPTIAAMLVACDPILLHQQSLVMTETLATFLAVLALWCLTRFSSCHSWFWAGLAGGAIGLAALCRPTFLAWLALVSLAMLFVRRRQVFRSQISDLKSQISTLESQIPNRQTRPAADRGSWLTRLGFRAANAIALLAFAATVMSPWVLRNYRVFGKPIITTTHGGYTFWLGNNESFYEWLKHDRSGTPWEVTPVPLSIVENANDPVPLEIYLDRYFFQLSNLDIERDHSGFIHACLYRVGQLWSPLPHKLTADESTGRRMLRYATSAWYCGVYALAAVGVWRLRGRLVRPPWLFGLLLCLAFTAVHTFYWTNLRMRAPLMPFIALVAAAGLCRRSINPEPEATA